MSGAHADLEMLLAYELGELDPAREAALEEHYLGCEACSARLAEVQALASGIKAAFDAGHVAAVLTPGFVEHARARGVRVREYVLPLNGSVNCTVAAEDQLLVGRLSAPLADVERLDVLVSDEGEHRLEDVPFDAVAGEVVMVPGIAHIRGCPAHRQVVRLIAVDGGGGERTIGEYVFNHSPHG